jgi:hypothetical protein
VLGAIISQFFELSRSVDEAVPQPPLSNGAKSVRDRIPLNLETTGSTRARDDSILRLSLRIAHC